MKKSNEWIIKELGEGPACDAVLELVNGKHDGSFSEDSIAELVNDNMRGHFSFDDSNLANDNEAEILANEITTAVDFMSSIFKVTI